MVENNGGVRFGYALKTRTIYTRLVKPNKIDHLVYERVAKDVSLDFQNS
jgi:hypothetical protein